MGSRVRIRLFYILHFVMDFLFPLLKNSKSGVDDLGHRLRSGSPVTNLPGASSWMAQCYHRQSCILVYWVIPNPRPWHDYFHVHLQLRECGVWLSSNNFCTAINNKLNLAMNRGRRPRGGRRQQGLSKFVC